MRERGFRSFYYSPIKDGKNAWLLPQFACMVACMASVIIAAAGVKRLSRATA